MTTDKLIADMDKALQFPGVSNAWTMPIKARIDMLATGIRTPVGVKVIGPDLKGIEKLAREIEAAIKTVPGTSSAFAERIMGGYYLEVEPDREALARYGLMIEDVQNIVASGLGAETLTTTVEGRERYGVVVRYPKDLRSDPETIAREVLVPLPNGASIPLGQVAKVKRTQGPASIRTENAQLAAYIYVDARERDLASYVADAKRAVAGSVTFPPGYYAVWSGQFEYYERAKARLMIVVPLTLALIFLLLYMNFGRMTETLIVMLSLPFALVGGLWLMWWLGFNLSVAVAVGFIALAGVAAETGVVMLIYLDHALAERRRAAHERRPNVHARRPARGDHGRRRRTRAPEDDDGMRHHGRTAAHPVEHRNRFGSDAAHRRSDDRRHGFVDAADADRDPRDLCAGQGVGIGAERGRHLSLRHPGRREDMHLPSAGRDDGGISLHPELHRKYEVERGSSDIAGGGGKRARALDHLDGRIVQERRAGTLGNAHARHTPRAIHGETDLRLAFYSIAARLGRIALLAIDVRHKLALPLRPFLLSLHRHALLGRRGHRGGRRINGGRRRNLRCDGGNGRRRGLSGLGLGLRLPVPLSRASRVPDPARAFFPQQSAAPALSPARSP